MKQTIFGMIAAVVLLIGAAGCANDDNPASTDINVLEQELVGLWWDEYEYADVTETGEPFSRALLAVKVNADHTGCLYLGVFDDASDEPLAVYGGPEEAGFTWRMLAAGTVVLSDPATGESIALSRTRSGGGEGSYGSGMTDVASTSVSYADGSVTVTNGDYSGTLDKADAGEQAEIEKRLNVKRTDLSMLDCAGNARSSQWTANCYMVHTAGNYELPLVYGNAIKNGETNSAAYTGVSGQLERFLRHDDEAITAPWIKDNGITVASAELLWQDAEGLITEVGIAGDYLTLTVGKDAATQEGNAVIAAKDGSGTIVWSWHIWVTTETLANTTVVATGSHNYTVAPVNLGWIPTGGGGKQGRNPYYQWGRKDPFQGEGSVTYVSSTNATIDNNITNPTTFYYNSSNYGPCNTTFYNMWDATNTETGNISTATKKTVYDPCPPGFCVPTGNLYYFIGDSFSRSMTTWDGTNEGSTWSNDVVSSSITGDALWFPAAGYRNISSGALGGVGSYGYYWSATPFGTTNGHYLHFHSVNWSWTYNGRAYGCPVRPVAEE